MSTSTPKSPTSPTKAPTTQTTSELSAPVASTALLFYRIDYFLFKLSNISFIYFLSVYTYWDCNCLFYSNSSFWNRLISFWHCDLPSACDMRILLQSHPLSLHVDSNEEFWYTIPFLFTEYLPRYPLDGLPNTTTTTTTTTTATTTTTTTTTPASTTLQRKTTVPPSQATTRSQGQSRSTLCLEETIDGTHWGDTVEGLTITKPCPLQKLGTNSWQLVVVSVLFILIIRQFSIFL